MSVRRTTIRAPKQGFDSDLQALQYPPDEAQRDLFVGYHKLLCSDDGQAYSATSEYRLMRKGKGAKSTYFVLTPATDAPEGQPAMDSVALDELLTVRREKRVTTAASFEDILRQGKLANKGFDFASDEEEDRELHDAPKAEEEDKKEKRATRATPSAAEAGKPNGRTAVVNGRPAPAGTPQPKVHRSEGPTPSTTPAPPAAVASVAAAAPPAVPAVAAASASGPPSVDANDARERCRAFAARNAGQRVTKQDLLRFAVPQLQSFAAAQACSTDVKREWFKAASAAIIDATAALGWAREADGSWALTT